MRLRDLLFFIVGIIVAGGGLFLAKISTTEYFSERPVAVKSLIRIELIQGALQSYFEACSKYPLTSHLKDLILESEICSGYKKPVNLSDEKLKSIGGGDFFYESDGSKYVIRSESLSWIEGTEKIKANLKSAD